MVVELRRDKVQSVDLIGEMDRKSYVPRFQSAQGHNMASTGPFLMEEAPNQESLNAGLISHSVVFKHQKLTL